MANGEYSNKMVGNPSMMVEFETSIQHQIKDGGTEPQNEIAEPY